MPDRAGKLFPKPRNLQPCAYTERPADSEANSSQGYVFQHRVGAAEPFRIRPNHLRSGRKGFPGMFPHGHKLRYRRNWTVQ